MISALTFDCYGTLIDAAGGRGAFLYQWACRHGKLTASGPELSERFASLQFELVQGPYRRYSDVLVGCLRRLAEDLGIPYEATDGQELVEATGALQPFAETRRVLQTARSAGLTLMLLSNSDRDIMGHTLRQLAVPFDAVVVAEDVEAYKPDTRLFERALGRLRRPASEVLHVAAGFAYDIPPAAQLGCRTAWINRRGDPRPTGQAPDHEWRSLWPLEDLIATLSG